MISDKLVNINSYKEIPNLVIDFLYGLNKDIKIGKYVISEGIYANVEIYETKVHENCKMEAHEKYIDIQLLLNGVERLDYIDRNGLIISEPYDEKRDVMFYKNTEFFNTILLDGSNFVLLYPHEAHCPQMAISNNPLLVKKVVVKIKVN